MTELHAQPYDISAIGFYFKSTEEYDTKSKGLRNDHGQLVEEFEIQFIDGELLDCELAKAWGLNQANLRGYFDVVEEWEDHQKINFIIAVGECNYSFDAQTVDPDDFEVVLYEEATLKDLAYRFVEEGLFGEVPEPFQFYIDYEAIARDLSIDYTEVNIGGQDLIYRCN